MLSTLCWIPRGVSAADPEQHKLSAEELAMMSKMSMNDGADDGDGNADIVGDADLDGDDDDDAMDEDGDDAMGGDADGGADGDAAAKMTKRERVDARRAAESPAEVLKGLDLDAYDEEDAGATMFLGGRNLTYYKDNTEDPYITLPDGEDDSDDEDTHIRDVSIG
jgi:periodic tryptophan protein 1